MLKIAWMNPTSVGSKTPISGLAAGGLRLMPRRTRQRWIALRDSSGLTQRFMTSVRSSSDSQSRRRSSPTSSSSTGDKLICRLCGVCERSSTVVRFCQRRTVLSLTPSSAASSATDALLAWM